MEGGATPPDPFSGMGTRERMKAQEMAILEMVYNLQDVHAVTPGERPDFVLQLTPGDQGFGVEITQAFPNESLARLNLAEGYMERLWSGGPHLHKADKAILKAGRFKVTDKDGNLKVNDLPGIFVEGGVNLGAYHDSLAGAIQKKAAKGYNDTGHLRHINLVILDWFNLDFNPNEYRSDRFLSNPLRRTLASSPFWEVFLLVKSTAHSLEEAGSKVHPWMRVVRLHELLAMESVYVVAHIISGLYGAKLRNVTQLNRLVVDYVSRVQGLGQPWELGGKVLLRNRGSLVEVTSEGIILRDHHDPPSVGLAVPSLTDRLPSEIEARLTEEVDGSALSWSYAPPANRPSTWMS